MRNSLVRLLKVVVHLLCLAPLARLVHQYQDGQLALNSDPVKFITHFTGHWALWILLSTLAITPIRRLSPSFAFLVRFRRMAGLYAFFYATLHLATYVFLFSGYDIPAALSGLKAGHPEELWTQMKLAWPAIKSDLADQRFVWAGLVAWATLLVLAVTSPTAVLRAMGGQNWRRLHWLVYLAAWAAITHFWWQMKPGQTTPWKPTVLLFVLLLARLGYFLRKKVVARRNLAS